MEARKRSARAVLAIGAALLGAALGGACGTQFDPPSKVNGVRIIAVTKDVEPKPSAAPGTMPGTTFAYAHPGDTVTLRMTAWDGKSPADAMRPLQVAWLAGCFNPAGDLYYGCYAQFADGGALFGGAVPGLGGTDAGSPAANDAGDAGVGADADAETDAGNADMDASADGATSTDADAAPSAPSTCGNGPVAPAPPPKGFDIGSYDSHSAFTISIPSRDQVVTRPALGGSPEYGLTYVFFAVCAGTILPDLSVGSLQSSGLPIKCVDSDGNTLGPDDFVTGYTGIYIYDDLDNQNPVVSGISFDNAATCSMTNHVGVCTAADRSDCQRYKIKPFIDPKVAELDPVAKDQNGNTLQEGLWINYYATAGDLKSSVRLLNDPVAGWNDDFGTDWQAPSEVPDGGTVRIWAVAHDNRGGIAPSYVDVTVDP